MWTSTTGGGYHGGYTYGPGPWVDAYRTADGAIVHRGYTYNPDTSSFTVDVPSMWPRMTEEEFRKRTHLDLDEEDIKVEIRIKELPEFLRSRVYCGV